MTSDRILDRRAFLALIGVGALGTPRTGAAQQTGKVYRVGFLLPSALMSSDQKSSGVLIPKALQSLGYVEGRNLVVERRYVEGKSELAPALASELVQLGVEAIITVGPAAARAAKGATTTIPIVMLGNFDPVAMGLVASLARPGGNITGVLMAPEGTLAAKKLELLKEAVPRAARIAFLSPGDPNVRPQVQEAQKAATSLGVKLNVVEATDSDYNRAFSRITADRPGALFVAATAYFFRDRKRIIELAAKHRLPAIYEWAEQVEDGGLMAYGASLSGLSRRIATYVDRIFKSARSGDLPVEQPTNFELVINLKTAKALGLALPQSLLTRADRVIQ